jgi:hypothetical protein
MIRIFNLIIHSKKEFEKDIERPWIEDIVVKEKYKRGYIEMNNILNPDQRRIIRHALDELMLKKNNP